MISSKRKSSIASWEISRAVLEKWNQSSDEGALLREIKEKTVIPSDWTEMHIDPLGTAYIFLLYAEKNSPGLKEAFYSTILYLHRLAGLPSRPPFETHMLGFEEVLKGYMLNKYPVLADKSGVNMRILSHHEKKLMEDFREVGKRIATGEASPEDLGDQIDLVTNPRGSSCSIM